MGYKFGYMVSPMSRKQIQCIVYDLRQKFNMKDVKDFPIVVFLENLLPKMMPDFELEICTIAEMGNKNGETFPKEHRIRIREDVYNGAVDGDPRHRMTLAHELGHLLLHEKENLGLCQIDDNKKTVAYVSSEWQANAFGGELLAPSYLIRGMSVDEIQRKFNVSRRAAEIQLEYT